MDLAPIVLFVYNRPDHARETIEALLRNSLASRSELFVYSDGPRSAKDLAGVNEVRRYLHELSGFKRVTVTESRENRGLAASIIGGVGEVVEKFGRVIVLEDDIVTSSCFLEYMNAALDHYADNEQVMHVSGYWFPGESADLPETFFLRMPTPWGWATWARAWKYFSKDAAAMQASFSKEDINRFNLDGACNYWEQVQHNLQGKANTWAVFWYASIFGRGGLCLYPSRSLSLNIGHDGTGVHCLTTEAYKVSLTEQPMLAFSHELSENSNALSCAQAFHRKHSISRWQRLLLVLLQRFRKAVSR